MEKSIFTSKFSGSYELFRYIIQTYKEELPYHGFIRNFVIENNYSEKIHADWKCRTGINTKVWNLLQKDLMIAALCGRIKDKPFKLELIKLEFEKLNK
jgi:hypothetical protein